jgi:hypothetical protein
MDEDDDEDGLRDVVDFGDDAEVAEGVTDEEEEEEEEEADLDEW